MGLLDTKTKKQWPALMANLKLQEIREGCRTDLRKRDEARGIVGGKVTTTIADPNMEGKTKDVVDPVKQKMAHTGAELNALLEARWREFCSKPQDLEAFVATTRTVEQDDTKAAKDAAAGIEKSLHEAPAPRAASESPKRSAGRPKKAEPVEA